MTMQAIKGRLLSFENGPSKPTYYKNGVLLIEGERIAAIGDGLSIPPDAIVEDFGDHLVLPGFIDTHIHYPQTQVIASYGAQLLEWLERYTFVEEQRFSDPKHAELIARFFFDELLRNGTTTAAVYCTTHPQSVDAFFEESLKRNACMIAGKVMMDRGAPPGLLDDAATGYRQSCELISRWHGNGRNLYAITPRFALTSSDAQLEASGALLKEHPDCYMQTHLAENLKEIEAVGELFPKAKNYTDVYDRYGLLGAKSVFGHCIHLSEDELARLADTGSIAAFCPTSNLFIGSGLFNCQRLMEAGIAVTLASDIGGGTSYSMLQTASEAYKVLQLQGQNLEAFNALHMMTAGNATALGLVDQIGTLEPGTVADLAILNSSATPAMAHRIAAIRSDDELQRLREELFILMMMADDRSVSTTYIAGRSASDRR